MGLIKNHESGFFEDINSDSTGGQQHRERKQRGQQTNGKHQLLRESALSKMASTNRNVKNRRRSSSSSSSSSDNRSSSENTKTKVAQYKSKSVKYQQLKSHVKANSKAVTIDDDESDEENSEDDGSIDEVDHHHQPYHRYSDAKATVSHSDKEHFSDDGEAIEIDDEAEYNSSTGQNGVAVSHKQPMIEDVSDDDVEVIDDSPPPPARDDDHKRAHRPHDSTPTKSSDRARQSTEAATQLQLEIEEASTIRPQGKQIFLSSLKHIIFVFVHVSISMLGVCIFIWMFINQIA